MHTPGAHRNSPACANPSLLPAYALLTLASLSLLQPSALHSSSSLGSLLYRDCSLALARISCPAHATKYSGTLHSAEPKRARMLAALH